MALGALILAASVEGPLWLLITVLIAEPGLVVCWNGLAFTAAGELAPARQTGTALGFQNTANYVSASATPPLTAVVITSAGYATAFGLIAVPALASAYLLRGRSTDERTT